MSPYTCIHDASDDDTTKCFIYGIICACRPHCPYRDREIPDDKLQELQRQQMERIRASLERID